MKTFVALMLAGAVGVLAATLAAQAPVMEHNAPPSRGVIYEGAVDVQMIGGEAPIQGHGRVYDGWIVIDDQQTMIPREQVRRIVLKDAAGLEGFGNQPNQPADDNSPVDPVRPTRRFRQD